MITAALPALQMVELAHVTMYRVLSGRCVGELVTEDDTCECDAALGGCDGSGKDQHGDECRECGGVGRVLGYPDVGAPVRLELVEEPSGGYPR